jgi:hypothetical protein
MQPTNVIHRFGWLVALVVLALPLAPAAPRSQAMTVQAQMDWGRMPLYFVANQGQMDGRVAYYVQGSDKTLYFTSEGVTFALISPPSAAAPESRWIVKLDFVGANSVQPVGQEQTEALVSYFKGPQDEWHTSLPTYSKIVYSDLWPGIELVYSGTVDRLKYEFVVQAGGDPARIRLAYRGATVGMNKAGQLEVSTPAGGFEDDAPAAYQEVDGQRVPVTVRYALEDSATYSFRLGAYDPALPLVIDPAVLVYCGYIGGGAAEWSTYNDLMGIAVDTAEYAYVAGATYSTEASFPVTVGPDLTFNGGEYSRDAFVAKVKADGTGLVYAGYIGGSYGTYGSGIAVDSDGFAYVTGMTWSDEASFPVLGGPDLTHNGGQDAFVAKVEADGTGLVYCGYIGGSRNEGGKGIAVDAAGNAYVSGATASNEANGFPVSVGPDLTFNGDWDTFVAKVKADGTGLDYCGYIGGDGLDYGGSLAVDKTGHVYVGSTTVSSESTFPVVVGPDLTHNGGVYDAYVAKVKADGSGLEYAGYIGGSDWDMGYGIAVDSADNAYVTGRTYSNEGNEGFPVTVGPDLTHDSGYDAFVAKVRADGTGLVYCGYIGGNGDDEGHGIALDAAGNAYVTGLTYSNEATFPVSGGPDLTYNGGQDSFVAEVKVDGTGLAYAGYIGGSGKDEGHDIALDAAGNAYVVGVTSSDEATFPVSGGPDLTYNGGDNDAFVAKISYTPSVKVYLPLMVRNN